METYKQERWTLTALLEAPSGEPVERALKEIEERTARFEAARTRLKPEIDAEDFVNLLKEYEDLNHLLHKVGAYAELWWTEDTQDQNALAFKTKLEQISADVANRTLFFTLWWKDLADENAARLLRHTGDYTYFLEVERKFKPYTLAEREEQIINIKDVNGIGALVTVFDMITNQYLFTLEVDGEKRQMTDGELVTYYRHPSPAVRLAAYQERFRPYREDAAVLAQIYTNRVNDWKAEQVDLRHFASPIAARNLANDIPDAAVDVMLETCRANAPVFQRYFKLKAKWIGMDKLRRVDIYAPLAPADVEYPWSDAVNLILDSFNRFSPVIAAEAKKVFDAHHVDSELRPRKRSGAFCASIAPDILPFVLINYAGKARDVSTLAHELGHAIHACLAREHTLFTFHSALPLAETASVFAEMILNERLLIETNDPSLKRDILARTVDDAYATVLRQAFFSRFEREAHAAIANGATMDEVCDIYWNNLLEQFGDALELQDFFRYEWIGVPHFYHVPFYVYAYSFGQLLTLALYQRYREQGDAFKPGYLKLLAYGGSASPEHILNEAGIDMFSTEFWQGGFDVIRGFIDQLEAL